MDLGHSSNYASLAGGFCYSKGIHGMLLLFYMYMLHICMDCIKKQQFPRFLLRIGGSFCIKEG